MPVQPQLFPETPEAPPPAPPRPPGASQRPAPLWLQRISLFILVIFCVYLGALVAIVPWWTSVWDHNLFFMSHPSLLAILRRGPVRGIISGVGLLDIWIGISEAVHYRETPAAFPAPRR